MMLEAGTLVLIPFPYSDLSAAKRRPVLVLTIPDSQGDFVAMPLTSRQQGSTSLSLKAGELPMGGILPRDSWIKTDTVFTLNETDVVKTIGRIADQQRIDCVHLLCQFLNRGT